ncbi:MAG TPA: isochorismatase family cysteine hydrolase [Klebsiella sp.]|jgi:nicotinamidase-related amidase
MTKKALLMLDFLNEIVHPDGVYARMGYYQQVSENAVIERAAQALEAARSSAIPVVHVVVGFSDNYVECPVGSEVFDTARRNKLLRFGTWSTDIIEVLAPQPGENIIHKHRVDPFYQTNLELTLRSLGVDTLVLAGVSTEFVVLATAMSAQDRGFHVIVLEDAVAAVNSVKHLAALETIGSTAERRRVSELFPASRQQQLTPEIG